jgi:hypothetical protein
MHTMASWGLTLARLAFPAWIGAAILFVINGVRLATSPAFDGVTRNHVAAIRFPPYYVAGACLLASGICGLLAHRPRLELSRGRWWMCLALAIASALIMAWDYAFVYRPLLETITPATRVRPPEFADLHRLSEWVNALHVGLAAIAAILVNSPSAPSDNSPARQ